LLHDKIFRAFDLILQALHFLAVDRKGFGTASAKPLRRNWMKLAHPIIVLCAADLLLPLMAVKL